MNSLSKIEFYESIALTTARDSYLRVVSILITDEKIDLIRWIIHQNPTLLNAREAKERCFWACNSRLMGKVLFPSIASLEDVESTIRDDKIKELVDLADLDLIDFFTKRGVKPLFEINRPKAPLIGFQAEDPCCIIDRYRTTSQFKEALYAAIEEKAEEDGCFAAGVLFYSEHGDVDGLIKLFEKRGSLPPSFDWERPILSSILNCHTRTLDLLLSKVPKDALSTVKQQHFIKQAVRIGVRNVVKTLVRHGYEIYLDVQELKLIESFQAWANKCEAKEIPILSHYTYLDRSLSQRHQKLYGGKHAQEIFKGGAITSVRYAMWAMSQKRAKRANLSFRDLLEALGCRRRHTAFASPTQKSRSFGLPRRTEGWTPLSGIYGCYHERAGRFKPVYITLNGVNSVLLTSKGFRSSLQCVALFHEYVNFWFSGDPVFAYLEELFLKCVLSTFNDGEELRASIANFHWLFSNIVPFKRGSAAVAEVMTDAMWLLHGYLPGQLPAGKSLDLEALFSSNVEDFIAIYPMGKTPD